MYSSFKKARFLMLLLVIIPVFSAGADTDDLRLICWGGGNSLVLDMLYMFPEAEDSVIAMGRGTQAGGSFQELLDAGFDDKAVLEMQLQPETVASYRPTHIILKNYMRKAAGALEGLGIPMLFIDMESPEQYDQDLTRIGELFDNSSRADQLKQYFKTELADVKNRTASLPETEKPRVLFLYYSIKGGSASLKVPPAAWIQSRMVEWAGGIPVWTEAVTGRSWQTVSFEQIAAWNPDTVFLVTYHSDPEEARDIIKADPLWQLLDAGESESIFAFPGDFLSWDQPDPRWILGLNWMGTRLHPGIFAMNRLEEKVYGFYDTAYGFSRNEVDKEIMNRITGDYR